LKLFPAIVGFFPTFFLVHLIKGGQGGKYRSFQMFPSPSQKFDVSKSASSTRFVLTQISLRFQFRFLLEKIRAKQWRNQLLQTAYFT
jgi:hypothetical protein